MSAELPPTVVLVTVKNECLLCPCSYYLDVLHQDYGGPEALRIAVFKGESPFTSTQSDDALNEEQNIIADYDLFDETQVRSSAAHKLSFLTFKQRCPFTRYLLLFRVYSL